MSYKNLQHYRHTVHRYLDAIWLLSSNKKKARNTMYKLLSTKMNLDIDETHVAKFNREQCKQAIQILRPMYISLYGKDLDYKKECKMYYSELRIPVNILIDTKVTVSGDTNVIHTVHDSINVVIYCKSKKVDDDGMVINNRTLSTTIDNMLQHKRLNDILSEKPTYENLAKYLYEQIIPCYKVMIYNDYEKIIYEEDEE